MNRTKQLLNSIRQQRVSAVLAAFLLMTAVALGQNPPLSGDPYTPRGTPESPDGRYKWVVRSGHRIQYELIDLSSGKAITSVNAYYSEPNSANLQFAKAYGVFWNQDGTVVALDELNRRRAGYLYFFVLRNGIASEIRASNLIPLTPDADEGRIVVDLGWVSATRIQVRQAVKTRRGDFYSKYFIIDFTNPNVPSVQPVS
ncbi:MAG TPA: hypothetical protein VE860_00140 [Chthoniobacterales bacterium]|jgi:hypothetical protein|nr:hypothetical protein [Chthoniobacterales bacterium]